MNASTMTSVDQTERKRLMGLLREPAAARYQDGMNLYEFVKSNPVKLNDPSGEQVGMYPENPGNPFMPAPMFPSKDDIANAQTPKQYVTVCKEACKGGIDGLKAWTDGALPGDQFDPSSYYDPNDPTLDASKIGGQLSMTAWSTAALLPAGPAGQATRWGTPPLSGNWVMTGGASWRNYIMTGKLLTNPTKCFTVEVSKDALKYGGKWWNPLDWAKWMIGQRVMK